MVMQKDEREYRAAIFATECLGCGCMEGGRHTPNCPWKESNAPGRTLDINVRKLTEQYGIRPRYAILSRDGILTLVGHSKEERDG